MDVKKKKFNKLIYHKKLGEMKNLYPDWFSFFKFFSNSANFENFFNFTKKNNK